MEPHAIRHHSSARSLPDEALSDTGRLSGVFPIADDTLITGQGSTQEEAVANHDKRMRNFLQRCAKRKILLNESEFRLKVYCLPYVGHILTSEGLRPEEKTVEAIQHMPAPTGVTGVRCLLGVVNYLARFLPNLSDFCRPLQQHTRKDAVCQWTETEV